MNRTFFNLTKIAKAEYREDLVTIWFLYKALFTSGAVLNVTVVYVLLRGGRIRQNISCFLVFHLSVTHLLFHTTIPLVWKIHGHKGTSLSCKILTSLDLACAAAIFNSMLAIAWDRYRNIMRPFKSLAPRSAKVYLMLTAAIWIYALVTSLPFLFSARTYTEVFCPKGTSPRNGTCQKIIFCHMPADWRTKLSRTTYFILAFVIPFIYIFFAYTKIAFSLWKRSKNGKIHIAVAKRKVKSTRLMSIAVCGLVFCWGPKFFVDLLTVYGVFDEKFFVLQIISYLAQMSSSSINPVIYAFFSREFRENLRSYCCCCCRSSRVFFRKRHRFASNRVESIM